MDRHEHIGDVRGHGLMLALELVEDRQTKKPLSNQATFEFGVDIVMRGLLLSVLDNQLRFFPPLIIDQDIADEMVAIVDRAIARGPGAGISRKVRMAKELVLSKLG